MPTWPAKFHVIEYHGMFSIQRMVKSGGGDSDEWPGGTRNSRVARLAGLCSVEGRSGPGRKAAAAISAARPARRRREPAVHRDHSLSEHDPNTATAPFSGSQEMERRLKGLVRLDALGNVGRGNQIQGGLGGHISSYASAATLFEVGFHY